MSDNKKNLPAKAPEPSLALTTELKQSAMQVHSYSEAIQVAGLALNGGMLKGEGAKEQAALKILAGHEMGLGPIASMQGLYVHAQSGTIGQKAELIKSKIAEHPRYSIKTLEVSDKIAAVEFFVDGKSAGVVDWDVERATTAGFFNGPNAHTWKKFTRNMLFKQCINDGARFYFYGLFGNHPIVSEDELIAGVIEKGAPGPAENIARARAEARAEEGEEIEITFEDMSEARADMLEKQGLVEEAEEVRELAYIDNKDKLYMMREASKNGWEAADVLNWLKEHCPSGTADPCHLKTSQFEKALAHFKTNKPG